MGGITPRALLPKGSVEWCRSTLDRLEWAAAELAVSQREYDKTLAELDEHGAWEVLSLEEDWQDERASWLAALRRLNGLTPPGTEP